MFNMQSMNMLELDAQKKFDQLLDGCSIRGESAFFQREIVVNLLDDKLGVALHSKSLNSHL